MDLRGMLGALRCSLWAWPRAIDPLRCFVMVLPSTYSRVDQLTAAGFVLRTVLEQLALERCWPSRFASRVTHMIVSHGTQCHRLCVRAQV